MKRKKIAKEFNSLEKLLFSNRDLFNDLLNEYEEVTIGKTEKNELFLQGRKKNGKSNLIVGSQVGTTLW